MTGPRVSPVTRSAPSAEDTTARTPPPAEGGPNADGPDRNCHHTAIGALMAGWCP